MASSAARPRSVADSELGDGGALEHPIHGRDVLTISA